MYDLENQLTTITLSFNGHTKGVYELFVLASENYNTSGASAKFSASDLSIDIDSDVKFTNYTAGASQYKIAIGTFEVTGSNPTVIISGLGKVAAARCYAIIADNA